MQNNRGLFWKDPKPHEELVKREAKNAEVETEIESNTPNAETPPAPAIRSLSVSQTAVTKTYNNEQENQAALISIAAPTPQTEEEKSAIRQPSVRASVAVDNDPDRDMLVEGQYKVISCCAKAGSVVLLVSGAVFQLGFQASTRTAMKADGYELGYVEKTMGMPYSGGTTNASDWDGECSTIAALLAGAAAVEWKSRGFAALTQLGAFKLAKAKNLSGAFEGVAYVAVGMGIPVAMVTYSLYRLTNSYASSMFSKGYNEGYYAQQPPSKEDLHSRDLKLAAASALAVVPSVVALGYGLFHGIRERIRPNRQVTVELTEVRTDALRMGH